MHMIHTVGYIYSVAVFYTALKFHGGHGHALLRFCPQISINVKSKIEIWGLVLYVPIHHNYKTEFERLAPNWLNILEKFHSELNITSVATWYPFHNIQINNRLSYMKSSVPKQLTDHITCSSFRYVIK